MDLSKIRNFVIIAHIDHGKSTLADRMLELTNTIEKRKMREQVLDQMELEREKGITIKMQPVRMVYRPDNLEIARPAKLWRSGENLKLKISDSEYILNLIDTPGHIDFSYEVSRALKAVEGAVLLVDATQGVEAQTITNVNMARDFGLVVIPVINKIDLASANLEESKKEIIKLLHCEEKDILYTSGKTGEGVDGLLEAVISKIPPPKNESNDKPRALVFNFSYSSHKGVVVYVRVKDGVIKSGDNLTFAVSGEKFVAHDVGIFHPEMRPTGELHSGEIGYIVTNVKKPGIGAVGDSIISVSNPLPPLSGYMQPKPVVWASIYPVSADDFADLKQALNILRLSDSALTFEEESSGSLGRGFRSGFLGMLHLEIITERLKREFNLNLVVASPTVTYKVKFTDGREEDIYSPLLFPGDYLIKSVLEPWAEVQIIAPPERIGAVIRIFHDHEAELGDTEKFGENRTVLSARMPLRELMRGFFDELKSATSGYASLSYKLIDGKEIPSGFITRLDVLVADEVVPAFSRIVSRKRIEREAEAMAEKLKDLIPRVLFAIKIQVKGLGRILASRTIPALKKHVTGNLYGGDRTRKMKLWQKQKKGKARMKEMGKVNIPGDVFIKIMQ